MYCIAQLVGDVWLFCFAQLVGGDMVGYCIGHSVGGDMVGILYCPPSWW